MLVVKNKKWNTPNVFDQFLNQDLSQLLGADYQTTTPQVNIVENDNNYQIELAAPGLEKENFEIQLDKAALTISYVKQADSETKKRNFLKREFHFAQFKRSFTIPEHVAVDEIKANYVNGLLIVQLPKKETINNNGPKTISIG